MTQEDQFALIVPRQYQAVIPATAQQIVWLAYRVVQPSASVPSTAIVLGTFKLTFLSTAHKTFITSMIVINVSAILKPISTLLDFAFLVQKGAIYVSRRLIIA